MKPTILAIIGKPLSGKDTQADLLVAHHPESVSFSAGQLIRDVKAQGPAHRFWHIIGPYTQMMEQGLKLPDEPTMAMLHDVIAEKLAEGKKLLVIAGSPRGLPQLDAFEQMAEQAGATFLVAHIDVTDEETYSRSAARGHGRVDDTPRVHMVRLAQYRAHVEPVVAQLAHEGKIFHIDGMQPQDVVYRQLDSEVGRHIREPETSLPPMARR